MSMIVAKFGGSSLANSIQFQKVSKIVKENKDRRVIIPSAPGKRDNKDFKITDLLYLCAEHVKQNLPFEELFTLVEERYSELVESLNLNISIEPMLRKIKDTITTGAGPDFTASRGEYINAIILAKLLGYEFVDAAEVIRFKNTGVFDKEETHRLLAIKAKEIEYMVIPGFYGADYNGNVITFSRGGSDVTGAIVAAALDAKLYENWTDVSGVMMADPRIVENPRSISKITYRELREMSNMGASVLHEDAVLPVKEKSIPIQIRNTNVPEDIGTFIIPDGENTQAIGSITGIAGKSGFTVVTIVKTKLQKEFGFYRRLISILEDLDIRLESMPMAADSVSIVIKTDQIQGKTEKLVYEINRQCDPEEVDISDEIALIGVIGTGMSKTVGMSAKIFTALSKGQVNIRMINQGSSEINVMIGVSEGDYKLAVKSIYKEFA